MWPVKLLSLSVIALCDGSRLLTLWFDYGHWSEVNAALAERVNKAPMETWLQVIPQLIARLDTPRALVASLVHNLLGEVGRKHPQVCPHYSLRGTLLTLAFWSFILKCLEQLSRARAASFPLIRYERYHYVNCRRNLSRRSGTSHRRLCCFVFSKCKTKGVHGD